MAVCFVVVLVSSLSLCIDEYISMSIRKYYQTGMSIAVSLSIPMYCPQLCLSFLFLPSPLLCSLCLRYCETRATDFVKWKKEKEKEKKKKGKEKKKRKKKREKKK